ncbi:MAG: 4-hydroxybenzoyl-CoA thioesterase [Verrucomicrobia bacterium]|nr:MAG: 4-hydroxybenzoyl-CoA thioesterase [Verrucomicrobiota bacterium]
MPHDFQITRRIEFSETDMAGIVHYSNYFRFMEAAETAFLRSLGYSIALKRGGLELCLPRVHAECDYSVPLRFEDEIRIHLLVVKKGKRTLTYQFRFERIHPAPSVEVARGKVVLVSAKRQRDGSLKAAPLPKLLADKIHQAPPDLLK